MEQNKNNDRLDELFNQANNEPSKVSFDEIKEQFIKSNVGAVNVSGASKLLQITNLKIIVMIATLSIVVSGAFLMFNNLNEPSNKNKENTSVAELITKNSELKEDEVVLAHITKVKQLAPNLKEVYHVKKKLALKIKEIPKDTLKKNSKGKEIAKRNKALLDTAYRFPNLGYEEITANNRQKNIMFGKSKKRKGNIELKGFKFIPSGTYSRDDDALSVQAFYMKQTEVTNLEYRTFLFDLLINGRKKEFLIAKPDQEMWVKEYPYAFNKPMQENYFSHPAYDQYPALGMSRKGAEMYCKWFTQEINKVTEGIKINAVRLPSNYEWEYAAKGGLKKSSYPWGGPNLRNSKGCYLANFKPGKDAVNSCFENKKDNPYSADGGFHTVKVYSYNPNDYGLYCMSGNVAEMVFYKNENGLPGTKGGSWTSVGQELQIVDGKDRFKGQSSPSVNVGFRPVITFLVKEQQSKNIIGAYGGKSITVKPPGTKKITNNLFFDETEITNFMWIEYLSWQERTFGKESNELKNALPDTTIWNVKTDAKSPFMSYYLRHPAYHNYPVVGVSYEQAVKFCKWRTDRVKEMFEIQKEKDKKGVYPKTFKYRLPTKQEIEKVARVGYSLKTLKRLETKYEGQSRYNLKRDEDDNMGVAGNLNDNADVTAPVHSYWPNKQGLYNLIGNVAEMTAEKGIAKGGSWAHQENEVDVEKDFKYSKPEEWLGFRCVFEVKE
ncbi:MAG: SUMF1/EgtB/PvdO family nonheme iron enzyme [Vicingaceae bacterium]|nr:SUMF1/EgtB/PvdO family nonheme iron enzyme [Vicingaceae bacterium]